MREWKFYYYTPLAVLDATQAEITPDGRVPLFRQHVVKVFHADYTQAKREADRIWYGQKRNTHNSGGYCLD